MTRPYLLVSLLLGAAAPTLAQSELRALRAPGPVRDAGTFHVATGTWTRAGQGTASIGPDAIYRNDAPSGYFGTGWESCWSIEEIALPGPDHPRGGPQDAYEVDGFDFAYCKNGAGTVDWVFGYYASYVPCDSPQSPANCIVELPTHFIVSGLPGGSACWTLTIDLSGGDEVCLAADGGPCNPGYQGNDEERDHAGLGFGWFSSDGGTAGPMLHGDPSWMPAGEGTCYDPGFTNGCGAPVATGLGSMDLFLISNHDAWDLGFDDCVLYTGCKFFGGYKNSNGCGKETNTPMAAFPFVLYTDCTAACTPTPPWFVYCDEQQNPDNAADIGITTANSEMDPIYLTLEGGPPDQFCYLLVGDGNQTVSQPPGAKGDLCVAGGSCLGRYEKLIGAIWWNGTFQTNIKSPLANPCQGGVDISAGNTWNFQYWHRQPMGQPATFSSALSVTFS